MPAIATEAVPVGASAAAPKEAERTRLTRALQAVSHCHRAVIHARDEISLLQDVCRTVVEVGGYRMAFVGYCEHDDRKTVRPVAIAGYENDYLKMVNINWDAASPNGRGPCGTSIRSGQICAVRDVRTSPVFAPWRLLALERGYASSCAVPLVDRGEAFGVVGIYSNQVDAFDRHEQVLLEELAARITFGILALRADAERRRNQELLQQSEQRYRSLALATSQIVWTTDPQGQVVADMPNWREFTGLTLEQIMGEGWLNSVHPEDRQRTVSTWAAAVNSRTPYDTEYRIRRADGEYRDMMVRGVPVLGPDGNPREWVGTCTDITERRQAQQLLQRAHDVLEDRVRERTAELAAANQELEAFASSVSHDLRAPLRHIQSFSKLLLEGHSQSLDEEGRHYLARICNGAERLSVLVDDLLKLAQIGRQALQMHLTALREVVESALADLDLTGRQIEWNISELPVVACDARLMKQVFFNLLSNAVKFTRPREKAVIEVGCTPLDHEVAVFVRDNGVGFDMKHAARLFGAFQRLHHPEQFEGTGIGLATVARIVQKHGGRVWAKAVPDRGATFYFSLPAKTGIPGIEEEVPCLNTK
jgi:PAS domain S-box-containing protein